MQRIGARLALCAALLVGNGIALQAQALEEAAATARAARVGNELRAALALREAGEEPQALARFEEIAQSAPVIADYADWLRIETLLELGELDAVLAACANWTHSASPLRGRVEAARGDAEARRSSEAAARAAWQRALDFGVAAPERQRLRLAIGFSLARSEELERAAEVLIALWSSAPQWEHEDELERALKRLEAKLGRGLRGPAEWLQRGGNAFDELLNESALDAYDRVLAAGDATSAQREAAQQGRARTLFRLRRYAEAEQAFGALPARVDFRIEQARSLARSGEPLLGAERLVQIAREASGESAGRARWTAGLLFEGEGQQERADTLFREVASAKPAVSFAGEARWKLAWSAYRAGDFGAAAEGFAAAQLFESDPERARRARYWRARAREAAGEGEAARESLRVLAAEVPLAYYGWRAREHSGAPLPTGPSIALEPGAAKLGAGDLERARILLAAGLAEDARAELDALPGRAGGAVDRLALADLYSAAGDFNRAQRIVLEAYASELSRGLGAPRELWFHAWPAPFASEMQAHCAFDGGPDPALAYSIMREESGYQPQVRSIAGALGLLQLMPDTARRVAARIGLPLERDAALFEPATNIRLGCAYLNELLQQFGGRLPAVIASYNAGPEKVAQWLASGPRAEDEWVEAIPYDQTREYVKRVLRSRAAFLAVHAQP